MQNSSDTKVYGITQQAMRHARAAFQDASRVGPRAWAHAWVMQMLRNTYELRKQGK